MRTKLSKIAHILIILFIGATGVQTITSCSGGDDDGGSGSGGGSDLPQGNLTMCGDYEILIPPIASPYCNDKDSVTIGTQTWQKCNLKVVPSKGSHGCYCNKPEYCDKYGRLYDWEAAMSACPSGFHLPTEEEWDILVDYAGGASLAGEKLKTTNWWGYENNGNGTDEFSFSALPGGTYITSVGGAFGGAGTEGCWWTATEYNDSRAYTRRIMATTVFDEPSSSVLSGYDYYKTMVFNSVRCIKD